ncbi:ATP-grasp domain-containing protein [Methanohalophilus profundi]|uniref:ATP-grasp domain-containing protein n=1 Tax=Methanohalophilus profundi TaxID=2138083 RepID=UPI00101DA584|nr:ATP-grasp domain-containing protein [Methanohalophilus profundi]
MKNILVIGYSSRNIACSANTAGYNVYAIDAFCDRDLENNTCKCHALMEEDIHEVDREEIVRIMDSFKTDFDGVVLGSGFEKLERDIFECPVLNNSVRQMEIVSDKKRFAKELQKLAIPHPETHVATNPPQINTPMILKPAIGGGGIFNKIVTSTDELEYQIDNICKTGNFNPDELILQEVVHGNAASVSMISNGNQATAIAVNEQLIGIPWLTNMPFAYCGNITPMQTPYEKEMIGICEKLCKHFKLKGSNGMDFIITEKGPVILEINARFQGSLDSVEIATGINLFQAHVDAFNGKLPEKPKYQRWGGRTIIYASEKPITISKQISEVFGKGRFADIPKSGYEAYLDDPVVSILAEGNSRNDVMGHMKEQAKMLHKIL